MTRNTPTSKPLTLRLSGSPKLLNKEGLKWCNGKKYKSLEEFTHHIESGCFFLLPKTGEWSHHNNNRETYEASKFLKPSKKELLKRIETLDEKVATLEICLHQQLQDELLKDVRKNAPSVSNLEVDFEKVEAKSELEVGKWYVLKEDNNRIACYKGEHSAYGFIGNGIWGTNIKMSQSSYWQLASETEVKEALIKEAERRGFKEGVSYQWSKPKEIRVLGSTLYYESTDNVLMDESGLWIFHNGEWAEIIEQPKEEIDFSQVGLIVESDYNVVVTNGYYDKEKFGGMVVSHKAGIRNRGYTGNIFDKQSYKLRKEPITISNELCTE